MGHSHSKGSAAPSKHHRGSAKGHPAGGLPDVEPTGDQPPKVRRSIKNDNHRAPLGAHSVQADYDIDAKVLGRGHYGVVRKCRHRKTGEECAVKSISKKRISRPEVLKREISILRTVTHPHIIEIKDVYEDSHHVFIVTELCTGGELFERIIEKTNSAEGHYSEHDAASLVHQVLDAIAYCHDMQISHRDLKPENFLFATPAKTSALKIIDFGLARIEETDKADSSSPNSVCDTMHTRVGTPYYIAPEVLARSYTKACDLWSIGVITYILLCGYPPFNGDSDVAIFERVKRGLTSRSFPKEDWDDISAEAKAFIQNLLSLDPMARMTAREALEHPWIVRHAKGGVGGGAESSSLSSTTAAPPKPVAEKKHHHHHHHRKKRLNGDQLAARLQNFVGMSKLKKVALNVLAHHLTEREISELSQIWQQIDTEKRGVITLQQLRDALVDNGHNATQEEMRSLLMGLDTDKNDLIDYWEFAASLLARNKTIRDDRVKEIFETLDQNHTGYIEVENLIDIMGSKEHALEVLGDDFPDGRISLDQFKAKLQDL